MVNSVSIMLGKWEKICGTQDILVNVYEHIRLLSLDTIMKCTFGQETNCQISSTHDHYVKMIFEVSKTTFSRLSSSLLHHDLTFEFSPDGRHLQKLYKILHQYTDQIIWERKKSLKDKKQGNTQKKYQDFLDIVLSAQAENGDNFSETDIRAEVNTFVLAGQDAVAVSLSRLLYLLAQNPEHQERRREEIRNILGDGSPITWYQLAEMSYTTMCIKECLRLFSPAFNISRELSKAHYLPRWTLLACRNNCSSQYWGSSPQPCCLGKPRDLLSRSFLGQTQKDNMWAPSWCPAQSEDGKRKNLERQKQAL